MHGPDRTGGDTQTATGALLAVKHHFHGGPPDKQGAHRTDSGAGPALKTPLLVPPHPGRQPLGLDVVRKQLEALRGKVELSSVPGEGTRFTLRLPLTLAIIEGMVIRVADTRYILPALSIEETLRAEDVLPRPVLGREAVLELRGSLLPVHRLDALLAGGDPFLAPERGILIVLESGQGRACFLADEVIGQQEVVIKSIGPLADYPTHSSGAAILGDGSVALILDVESLFRGAKDLVPGARDRTPAQIR